MDIISHIERGFIDNAKAAKAEAMSAYLKNQFSFYGLQRDERWPLYRAAWSSHPIGNGHELSEVVYEAWSKPQREFHYFAIECVVKYKKYLLPEHLELIVHCITTQSWWDTVDMFAAKIGGYFFQRYPELISQGPDDWVNSENIWLIRSAILNQLFFDEKNFNEKRLFKYIELHKHSKEFFIAKAIGWALRQYGKRRPDRVQYFLAQTELQPLSVKEASKKLK